MSRDPSLYLDDIVDACERIERYTAGLTDDAFRRDQMTVDAVVRNLEIIGEAVNRLPDELKAREPEVPWRRVIDFRNLLVHAYFGVDLAIVWDVVRSHVPQARAAAGRLRGKALP